ncbi:hypothetical protein Pint_22120 [Pistacia integerrima]|uniref:Uncharacterized protein n=1 Tax=Pistacia integerrima TaxID=434235 RepID=A0ACC0YJM7_9ROSI|nr:hypothetical protein Pint_22120 [Pistacia integerrima]
MRREGSLLTFSNFLVSVLIFLFITEIQARKLQQECSSSCGDINNIRYPFRLKGDPAVCGHSDFELSRQSNKTILEFHSGKYYVKGISHKENTISVVDVNLASGTCRLPYGSTVMPHFSGYQHQFCSLNAVTPIYYRPYELFGNNTNHYETIRKSLQSGFNLTWYLECRDCLAPVVVVSLNHFMDWYVNIGFLLGQLPLVVVPVVLICRFIAAPIVLVVRIGLTEVVQGHFSLRCGCGHRDLIWLHLGTRGFEMSCSNGKTMLHLPFSSGYYVQDISYLSGSITIMDMNDTTCPIQSLLSLNLTNSRFYLEYDRLYQMYALLNCTVKITWTDSVLGPFDCISDERKFIYATDDQTYEYVWMPPVCSWYKTVNISIDYMYRDNQTEKIVIVWEALDGCWDCEKSGNYCGFNTTSNSTICIKNKLISYKAFSAPDLLSVKVETWTMGCTSSTKLFYAGKK